MISYFKRTIRDKGLRKLPGFETGCWINVVAPTKKELDFLEKKFKLNKQNLESGLDANEIPRVEIEEGRYYIFLKSISFNLEGGMETILIVLDESFIMTLARNKLSFLSKLERGEVNFFTTQRKKVLLKIFSLLDEEFERATLEIVKKVKSERRLSEAFGEKEINDLLLQEDKLNDLVFTYYYSILVYKKIIKSIQFFEEDQELIEDLIIEAEQGFNLCKSSLKTISNIRNSAFIFLSNRLNRAINLLTVLTILISIPAAVSGIYGMNLILPFQNSPYAFYYVMGIIFSLWILFIIYLRKKIKKIL